MAGMMELLRDLSRYPLAPASSASRIIPWIAYWLKISISVSGTSFLIRGAALRSVAPPWSFLEPVLPLFSHESRRYWDRPSNIYRSARAKLHCLRP